MKITGYWLVIFMALSVSEAGAEECTKLEAYAAETVTDYLDSWRNMNLGYTQFKHCDDGSIGEGFSEATARLFVGQWGRLSQFQQYALKNPSFEKFVLSHIDATLNVKDLKKIQVLAETACPTAHRALCAKIAERSKAAQADQ